MLDFVARPQSDASFPIGRQWRCKALSFQLALLCALLPGGYWLQASSTDALSRRGPRCGRSVRREQSKMDAARQELEQIPPPSKNRYLSVRTKEAYANPFLVVHPQTITLTIIYRDQDPNAFTGGGMLRPAKARKQEVDVRPERFAPGTGRAFRPTSGPMAGWLRLRSHPPPQEPSASRSAAM